MESLLGSQGVTFEVLRTRLLKQLRLRIDNGEFTERGLARILGISQSQTHNVLKGVRLLQMQLADRILTRLGISAVDLLNESELNGALRLKMAEWDREMAESGGSGFAETEFDIETLFGLKMAAARSETRSGHDERKTG